MGESIKTLGMVRFNFHAKVLEGTILTKDTLKVLHLYLCS